MRSWLLALVALAVLVATVAAFPGAVAAPALGGETAAPAAQATPQAVTAGNASDNATDVTPGESVAGALAVQGSDVERDLESRAFDVRLSRAANASAPDASRGRLLATELRAAEVRLAVLEDRKAALRTARAAGNVSDRAFRVRMARLVAETRALNERIERLETTSDGLPNETRDEYGLTDATFERLATASSNLTDAETERLFRSFVGNHSLAADYPREVNDTLDGDGDTEAHLSADIDRVSAEVSFYREQYRQAEARAEDSDSDSEEVREALACAREHIAAAEEAVRNAREAADRGDLETARSHLRTARTELAAAVECVERARENLYEDGPTPTTSGDKDGSYDYNKTG